VLKAQANQDISGIDAVLVGVAEDRSRSCAVTILTTDLADIQPLADRTRRPNLAVDPVG
jgi:hypothetical protein